MRSWIRRHYHWIIALVMLLQMGFYVGLLNNDSLFVIPVSEGLGISRSSYSLIHSLYNLVAFLMVLFSGPLVRRFGYRKMAIITLPLACLGYVVYARSGGALSMCLGSVLLGVCSGFCSSSGVNRVINDWFHRHRGAVLGVVSAASGIGGSICCTALSSVMEWKGWRGSYLLAAALVAAVWLLNVIFVHDNPQKMGLVPYGEGELLKKAKHQGLPKGTFQGYSFRELSRRPVFYLTILVMLLTYMSVYLPGSPTVAHLRECGLSEAQAVNMQSLKLLVLTVAKVLCGFLMDLIGVKWVTLLCLACGAASMWLLPAVSDVNDAILAITLYACSLPLTTITIPLLTMDLFGYHSFGTAIGVFSAMVSVGNMLAAPISNAVYDRIGTYSPVFRIGTAAVLVLIVAYLVLFRLSAREKIRWQALSGDTAPKR